MDDRIQIFVRKRWQFHQPHSFVFRFGVCNVVAAAVDRDFMPARRKALTELFYASFKPAVTGRDAARAEQSDFHIQIFSLRIELAIVRNCILRLLLVGFPSC